MVVGEIEHGVDDPYEIHFNARMTTTFTVEVVGTWRGLSQKAHAKGADPAFKEELAALTKKVEAADARIREAATPRKMHFEIVPVAGK